MLEAGKPWPPPCARILLLLLIAFSAAVSAQDKDTKDKGREKEAKSSSGDLVKLEGKVRCEKPDTLHSIDVPDRPGHVLILEKRVCAWTEPMAIRGAKEKDGVLVNFTEKMEGTLHTHAFEVGNLDSGEQLTMHVNGEIFGEKGPATGKGRWYFMRGTGTFKGIKGYGTFAGKLEADDVLTLEFEGVYDRTTMAAEKK